MKDIRVAIGEKSYPLRFTSRDAIELKSRFGKSPTYLVFQCCYGLEPAPNVFYRRDANGKGVVDMGLVDLEVQIAFLHTALARGSRSQESPFDEGQLADLIDKHVAGGGTRADIVVPAVNAALQSGAITGQRIDMEEKPKPAGAAEGDEEDAKAEGIGAKTAAAEPGATTAVPAATGI